MIWLVIFANVAWNGEHQITCAMARTAGIKNGILSATWRFRPECSERSVNHCLMTITGQNHCVRQLQILFQRESIGLLIRWREPTGQTKSD